MTLLDRLGHWYFAPAPARHLALVRIGIGAYGIVWLVLMLPELLRLGDLDPSRYEPVGVLSIVPTGPLPTAAVAVAWAITLAAACTVVTGRGHGAAGPVFAVGLLVLASHQNSWGKLLHTENLLVFHALVLAISPAGDALVLRRPPRAGTTSHHGWPMRAMAVATVLAYVAAGVSKLRHGGLGWMTAENLQSWVAFDLVRKELFGDPYLEVVVGALDHAWPFAVAAVYTVGVELVAPLALLGRRWARAWIVAAWLLHAGVLVVMAVGFPYQLVGVAFLPVLFAPPARADQPG